ncbi:alpha/beta hydrolase fold, partial [Geosmithia morbida]
PFKVPSLEETINHPSYGSTVWALEPHRSGLCPAAQDRGGPINIAWEIHGDGPIKLVLISGLAGVLASWQRQTRYFGHDHGSRYSVLILDNRGMGRSDKPLGRYTTSGMARDVLDVIDHVGWGGDARDIHLVGISMGGMIAQEVACLAPRRLASLSLLCTSASVSNTTTLREYLVERAGFLVPKSTEQSIADTARKLFHDDWLGAPDAEDVPSPDTTPRCAAGVTYGMFDSNFQRFQAQELAKRRAPGVFTRTGFLCQLVAVQWHSKSPQQLKDMADAVGRERILVMHGTDDHMITVPNGRRLIDALQPGTGMIVQNMSHAPVMDRCKWFNELLDEKLQAWAQI